MGHVACVARVLSTSSLPITQPLVLTIVFLSYVGSGASTPGIARGRGVEKIAAGHRSNGGAAGTPLKDAGGATHTVTWWQSSRYPNEPGSSVCPRAIAAHTSSRSPGADGGSTLAPHAMHAMHARTAAVVRVIARHDTQ